MIQQKKKGVNAPVVIHVVRDAVRKGRVSVFIGFGIMIHVRVVFRYIKEHTDPDDLPDKRSLC